MSGPDLSTNRGIAAIYLESLDGRLSALAPLTEDPRTPTNELHAHWAEGVLIGLLGVGRAVLDLADATREHTQAIKNLAAEGSL